MSFRQMWTEIEKLTGARCKLSLITEEYTLYLQDGQPGLCLQWVVEVQNLTH